MLLRDATRDCCLLCDDVPPLRFRPADILITETRVRQSGGQETYGVDRKSKSPAAFLRAGGRIADVSRGLVDFRKSIGLITEVHGLPPEVHWTPGPTGQKSMDFWIPETLFLAPGSSTGGRSGCTSTRRSYTTRISIRVILVGSFVYGYTGQGYEYLMEHARTRT